MRRPHPTPLALLVPALSGAAFLATACSSEPIGPTADQVQSVEVSPGTLTLREIGESSPLTVRVLDVQGRVVPNPSVTWHSDASDIASVTSSGVATAEAEGVARIRATLQGVSGEAVVTVLPPTEACAHPTTVSLPVGGYRVFGARECFMLPSGSRGDRYRVVVLRPDSGAATDVVSATLSVGGMGVSATASAVVAARPASRPWDAPRPALAPGLRDALRRSGEVEDATRRRHAALRAGEERMVRELGPSLRLASPAPPSPVALQGQAPSTIRVNPATSCEAGSAVTGVLLYADDNLAFYQDSAQNASSPVSRDQAMRMADYYERYGKSLVEEYFGAPTDIDGNGRIQVFATPAVASDDVAAFVWSGDFVAKASCEASNEGEYIFFNSSLIQSMDDADPNYQALETLVHEVKHVSSLFQRLRASERAGNQPRFHPLWMEEGLAEVAGNLSSRIALAAGGGPPPQARLTLGDLVSNGSLNATPENYGVLLRMVRTVGYLSSQPNGLVVSPQGAHPLSSIYGSGWHFHRWLGDAYGDAATPGAEASLFRFLTDSLTAPGPRGLGQVTGTGFETLLEEYALAVAVHETGAPPPPRSITSYDFPAITDILCGSGQGCTNPQPDGLYPWPVTERARERGTTVPADFTTAEYVGPIGPTGLRVHDFRSNGTGTGARIAVRMTAPGRVVVARIR